MKLVTNEDIDLIKWKELELVSGFSSPFQTNEFYKFINNNSRLRAEVFAVENDKNYLVLILVVILREKGIKGYFSRRGIIYGGPLLSTKDDSALQFILHNISKALRNRVIYLETRNFFNYEKYKSTFLEENWSYTRYLNFQINVKDKNIDDALSQMKYNRRREIKLSIANGASYRVAESIKEVEEVYLILKQLFKERVKLPIPDWDFFRSLYFSETGKVFVVLYEGKIIAGSFCMLLPERNIYTWDYCGFREIEKKIYPTSLAVFAVIDYAVNNNITLIDMMGAGKPDIKYGVRDYKSQFGGDLVEHGRFLRIVNPQLYYIGKYALKLLSKLK